MSLSLLLALVVGGIAGIVLLVHLTGGSARRRFPDDAVARAEWAASCPEHPARTVQTARSGDAVLLTLASGEIGLMWSFGAEAVARVLRPGYIRSCKRTAKGLALVLNDFDAPRLALTLTDEEASDWTHAISPYVMGYIAPGAPLGQAAAE